MFACRFTGLGFCRMSFSFGFFRLCSIPFRGRFLMFGLFDIVSIVYFGFFPKDVEVEELVAG